MTTELNQVPSELYRALRANTFEIERLVAEEQDLGDINDMNSREQDALTLYVEQLIEDWEDKERDAPGEHGAEGSPFNALMYERYEIEQEIEDIRDDEIASSIAMRTTDDTQTTQR
jgi:hypothetical protein